METPCRMRIKQLFLMKTLKFLKSTWSACFEDADGSFVFYDLSQDTWQIYNKEKALIRYRRNSTYKIYGALFALNAGLITPENSEMAWDGEIYAFDAWNQNQDLNSAMKNSVNWYFQTLEEHMGKTSVQQYIDNIDYGNRDLSGSFPSCWLESSLKISPAEQVYLLKEIFAGSVSRQFIRRTDIFCFPHQCCKRRPLSVQHSGRRPLRQDRYRKYKQSQHQRMVCRFRRN